VGVDDVSQGGTSGIGAAVVKALASRGAQIILLTRHAPNDPFLVDYIEEVRSSTNNELVYAEQVDLSSLHSIRLFATKWVDNAPPRRLDMIILCAAVMTPRWGARQVTADGLEEEWGINYLANFHLLSILSPAIRAQPPDRDVRVLFSTCNSYIGATLDLTGTQKKASSGQKSYGRSKLALMIFAVAFQKHLDSYSRPDKQPNNARAFLVDPGQSRTPGTRRWLTGGSLWGLLAYLITWPIWWLILKSPEQGAQSYLLTAMERELGREPAGQLFKECRQRDFLRTEVCDLEIAKKLWEFSEKQIEQAEKEGAVKRALAKKEKEAADQVPVPAGKSAKGKEGKATSSRRSRKAAN
jgi:NAD(P)-dependent dehydrogenase (short-subunit alcohol dehydrogenase family)